MRDDLKKEYYNENLLFDNIDDTVLKDRARKRKNAIRARKMRREKKLRRMAVLAAAVIVVVALGSVTAIFGFGKRSSIKKNEVNTLEIAAGDEAAGNDIIRENPSGQLNGAGGTYSEDNTQNIESTTAQEQASESDSTAAEEQQTKPSVNGIYTKIDEDDINSKYAVLYDCDKKITLAGLNQHERIYPASMTKILTLIVAVENIKDLSKTYAITQSQIDVLYKRDASVVGLERNKPVTARDCLYGLVLPSGADAAVALACMAAGSEEKFAEMMNAKCKELGLVNSHFTNATGLHDVNQYTTVYEMCKILECAMNNPTCAKVLNTTNYTMKATTKTSPNGISISNNALQKLKKSAPEGITIMGAKTGFTNNALYCMASCAVKNGTKYIVVTAKAGSSSDYIKDACTLYTDYCK